MEFLVHITITLPRDMPEAERDLLLHAEHSRGQELRREATISRIWRIPAATQMSASGRQPTRHSYTML